MKTSYLFDFFVLLFLTGCSDKNNNSAWNIAQRPQGTYVDNAQWEIAKLKDTVDAYEYVATQEKMDII